MLILDEPTQGIDVGAKAEIHSLMGELAAQGLAILMISSELPEVLGMSDRIAVMRAGRIAGVLTEPKQLRKRAGSGFGSQWRLTGAAETRLRTDSKTIVSVRDV